MKQLEITDLFKGAYFLTRSFRIKEIKLGNRIVPSYLTVNKQ